MFRWVIAFGALALPGLGAEETAPEFAALRADLANRRGNADGGRRLQGMGESCAQHGDVAACPMAALAPDLSSMVMPGGDTRCIFDEDISGPFGFQIIPGVADKLLLYFDGGGACFNQFSTGDLDDVELLKCTFKAQPKDPSVGIFDSEDGRNPYKKFTKVIVQSCSGDMHIGNTERPYTFQGSPVVQRGMTNTQAVLDWVAEQQRTGAMASELEELVVVGESIATLGLLIWAADIVESFPAKKARVISEGFVGVLPEEAEANIIEGFNPCGLLSGDVLELCEDGTLMIEDLYFDQFVRLGQEVPYLIVSGKEDVVQTDFYNLIVASELGGDGEFVNPAGIYARSTNLLNNFLGANYAAFWVQNELGFHTFTDGPLYLTVSVDGADTEDTGDNRMAFRWLAQGKACAQCAGELAPTRALALDPTLCDAAQADQCASHPDRLCAEGVLSSCGNVCCDASCGVCGGCGCAFNDGGAENCCPATIRFNGMACMESEDVACVVDDHLVCGTPGSGCDL